MEGFKPSEWGQGDIDAKNEAELINEQELLNRFAFILLSKPELHYHPELVASLGDDAKCSDDIVLIWYEVNGRHVQMAKILDRDGDIVREDISQDAGFHEAEPTVVQIAKTIAMYGEPKMINYTRYDTLWRIDGPNAKISHEVVFKYSEVASEILKLARGLDYDGKFRDMSLSEIGAKLMSKKEQDINS